MAEILQKIISCPKGHYYDANQYDRCPLCASGTFPETEDPFSPGNGGGDRPREQPGRNFSNTIDPLTPTNPGNNMGKTQFVNVDAPAGAPAPVVGWLVAVDGPCRGTDYRIHTGYNYIGRETGDIRIRGDAAISAEKDANVTYVPQTKRFYIAHELGKNVLLVNDLPVIGGGVELHNYDRITIGNTKLLFVGLCGEQFSWADGGKTDG